MSRSTSLPVLLVVFALITGGCSNVDDPVAPAASSGSETGTVHITPEPEDLAAAWTLTGPGGYTRSGSGAEILAELTPGEYSVTWVPLRGYQTPDAEQQILSGDSLVTFTGAYTLHATADDAIASFRAAYAARKLDAYGSLLSQEFFWIPTAPAEPWPYVTEMAVADQMFNGLAGNNSYVISHISFDQLEPQGLWQPTPPNDPNFGACSDSRLRYYMVDIKFFISGRDLILRVQGGANFYVFPVSTGEVTFYEILGISDMTLGGYAVRAKAAGNEMDLGKATENMTWSSVKALFH
jgi:hypothetical protein